MRLAQSHGSRAPAAVAVPAARSTLPITTLLVVLAALAACRRASPVSRAPDAPIVLVSIDTLRADRLPSYGYAQGRTPALDALAREGVVFEDAYSHCPLTLPSHASLFTGLLPPRHGVRDNVGFTLGPDHATLASRFRAAGRPTGGAVSAFVLRAATGIGRGFDFYEDAIELEGQLEALGSLQRDGGVATDALGHWIGEQAGRPFFAFLHLYEPHSPYAPPARYAGLTTPYDGEVAYADELVGRLLERLKQLGVYERAVIAVVSDHGEGLKDHGEEEHGIFLYKEAVHVPLLLRLPGGVRGGTRLAGNVGLVDLPATLLDLAGLATDDLDGRSLLPAVDAGRLEAPPPVYSETFYPRYHFGWSELHAVTDVPLRYVQAPRPELYDVGRDPGETRNLIDERATAAAGMSAWLAEHGRIGAPATPESVSPELQEKLQALGYIGGGAPPPTPGSALPDPKDKIGVYQELKHALALKNAARDVEAVEAFRKVLKENPTFLDAWETLGFMLVRMGRTAEGVAAIEKALEMDPGRMTAHLALARVFALGGDVERATIHAEIASQKNPGQAFEVLAQIMMDKGDRRHAVEFARRSVAADDQRLMSWFILGLVAQQSDDCQQAIAHFRKAVEAQSRRPTTRVLNLHAGLGDCLARLGREAEAEREFQEEIRSIPASVKGRTGLALLYRAQGRNAEARQVLGGLVTAQPQPDAEAYATVVHTFVVLGDLQAAAEWAARARTHFPSDPRFRPRGG
jgi:choline-sulfatase